MIAKLLLCSVTVGGFGGFEWKKISLNWQSRKLQFDVVFLLGAYGHFG